MTIIIASVTDYMVLVGIHCCSPLLPILYFLYPQQTSHKVLALYLEG